MPRKIRISSRQSSILLLLEEAGEETVSTLAASLRPIEMSDLSHDLDELVRLGFVERVNTKGTESLVLTAAGRGIVRS